MSQACSISRSWACDCHELVHKLLPCPSTCTCTCTYMFVHVHTCMYMYMYMCVMMQLTLAHFMYVLLCMNGFSVNIHSNGNMFAWNHCTCTWVCILRMWTCIHILLLFLFLLPLFSLVPCSGWRCTSAVWRCVCTTLLTGTSTSSVCFRSKVTSPF